MSRPIRRIPSFKTTNLKDDLHLPRDTDYVVLWYGANARARTEGDVPTIYVWFRPLYRDSEFGDWEKQKMASTFLGQLRIGSIWRNGISTDELEFDEFDYTGSYMPSHWEDIVWAKNNPGLIPSDVYRLPYQQADQSRLLRFQTSSQTLLVPCMEFFSRCYARANEVNRILLTYGDKEVDSRLMLQEPIDSSFSARTIWIPPFTTDADAHLLARLRYDANISKKLKSISAELDNQLMAAKNNITFLALGPWYYGPAKLKVQGINLGNGNFLGLRIVGHTLPEDIPVHAIRLQKETDRSSELASYPRPRRRIHEVPEGQTIAVTQELQADRDTDIQVIHDPGIKILNTPAAVTTETVRRDRHGRTIRVPSAPNDCSSPGEVGGTGKGVGSLQARSESFPTVGRSVLKLWTGLVHLQELNPNLIHSVAWCSSNYQFQGPPATPEPSFQLPTLKHPRSANDIKDTTNWLYRPGLSSRRSVFVFRVQTDNFTGYIFEVERAVREVKNEAKEKVTKEDNYCGLVAIPKNGCNLNNWLNTIIEVISWKCGKMKKVLSEIGNITSHHNFYPRSKSDSQSSEGQATAILALNRLGINNLKNSK